MTKFLEIVTDDFLLTLEKPKRISGRLFSSGEIQDNYLPYDSVFDHNNGRGRKMPKAMRS